MSCSNAFAVCLAVALLSPKGALAGHACSVARTFPQPPEAGLLYGSALDRLSLRRDRAGQCRQAAPKGLRLVPDHCRAPTPPARAEKPHSCTLNGIARIVNHGGAFRSRDGG